MSKDRTIAELSVRVARAEMELDAAIERAGEAEERARQSARAYVAMMNKDPEAMLDTVRIMGIPARDMKDLFDAADEWSRRNSKSAR